MWPDPWEPSTFLNSFHHPVPVLGVEPDAAPLVCVHFNETWRPVILGALLQLLEYETWVQSDPAALLLQQQRSYTLLRMFGLGELCSVQEEGLATLTIPTGQASQTANITFSQTYTAVPNVDVSCDNPDLIASWGAVTETGFVITITAATPVTSDTTGDVSWSTNA